MPQISYCLENEQPLFRQGLHLTSFYVMQVAAFKPVRTSLCCSPGLGSLQSEGKSLY